MIMLDLTTSTVPKEKFQSVPIFNLQGEETGKTLDVSSLFIFPFRPDLIKRAVLSTQSTRRVPYGVDPLAGKRTTAESWGTGRGVSRVPRIKGSRHHAGGRGAFIPTAVGGRRTHPPESRRRFDEKINRKERLNALRSAIAATANPLLVEARGHIISDEDLKVPYFPLIAVDDLESITKTRDMYDVFLYLGLIYDVLRARERRKKIRAGKGKARGRRKQNAKTVLIVAQNDKNIRKAARNFPGVDVSTARNLNTELLAPGTHPGRLTLWSVGAIEELLEKFK